MDAIRPRQGFTPQRAPLHRGRTSGLVIYTSPKTIAVRNSSAATGGSHCKADEAASYIGLIGLAPFAR